MTDNIQIEVHDTGRQNDTVQGPLDSAQQRERIDPTLIENNSRFKSDVDRANPLSRLFFAYGIPLSLKGTFRRREPITEEDLVTLPWKHRPDTISNRISHYLEERKRKKPNKKINVALAVFKAAKWMILRITIIEIIFVFARLFSTWVLKKLIETFADPDASNGLVYGWSCVLAGTLVIGFFAEHHWNHPAQFYPGLLQNALVDLLFGKLTRLSGYSLLKISSGRILNLATNDLNFLENFGMFFPSLIVGPVAVLVGAVICWQSFGYFTLIGIAYVIIWWPLQEAAIFAGTKTRTETSNLTNKRIKTTSETIESIRLLKMYTWEMRFKEKIEGIRVGEMKLLKQAAIGQAVSRAIAFSIQNCGTFLMYLAYVYTGRTLDVAGTFSAYFVFSYLRSFASYFMGAAFIFLEEARIVFKTIGKVLEAPEIGDVKFEEPQNRENSVEFENFTAFWQTDDPNGAPEDLGGKKNPNGNDKRLVEQEIKPVLSEINLKLKKGSINALVGTVGASKTSFLMSFTGEMPKTTGSLRYKGTIAYVEQEPTLFAGTFRDNVLFGKPFDQKRYDEAVKACNLESDLKLFDKGDQAMIVGGGNNLSGGQKARLAFARAVYSNADIYLLDDPLSAVDPKVARSLYKNAIEGALKGKTIILVTHQVDFVKNCENIIVMEKGKVLGSGTLDELQEKGVHPEKIFGDEGEKDQKAQDEHNLHLERGVSLEEPKLERGETSTKNIKVENSPARQRNNKPEKPSRFSNHRKGHRKHSNQETRVSLSNGETVEGRDGSTEGQDLNNEEEDRAIVSGENITGKVSFKTYVGLIKEMGGVPAALLIFVVILCSQFSTIAYGRILGAWTSGTFADWKTAAILGGLVGFDIFIFISVYISISLLTLRAARRYHEKMLNTVINAKVLFFDTNSVGEVINRFSSDTGTMDRFIPNGLTDTLNIFAFLVTIVVTAGIINPIFLGPLLGACLIAAIILALTYSSLQQCKMFEGKTKGPAFGLFSETLSGLVIMRMYNQGEDFKRRFREHLNRSVKGNFNFSLASRVGGFYSDFAYNAAVIGCIFISAAQSRSGGLEAAYLSAFALALLLGVTGLLQHGLRQFSTLNISMASVARIQEYCSIPQEPPLEMPSDAEKAKNGWPSEGKIETRKVYMKYVPDGNYVVKDLDLEIKAGEKIGCVGRTGAGKSTIVQLLYRMREIDRKEKGSKESYVKMDDVDTQSVGLHLLRGNISMIPQVPYIFSDSVRANIDPLGKASDEDIWKVLEDVRLKEHIENQPGKLDAQVSSGASIFSVGQKQLVCLARVVLKPSSVLIMDEATANMDHDTDNFLQEKIDQRFADSTRITIAHRLTTIANYDKVLVLSKGRKVEFDEPYKMLVKNIGDEELTNKEGYFSTMVQNTGPISSKQIFDIAKKAYYERHNDSNGSDNNGDDNNDDSIYSGHHMLKSEVKHE